MNSYASKTSIHCLTVGKLDDIVCIVPEIEVDHREQRRIGK